MPTKIFHKDHGVVITNNPDEISQLVAKGGQVFTKNSELNKKPVPIVEPETANVKPEPYKRKGK